MVRDAPTRLTFDPAVDRWPIWTPDGDKVVFSSGRDGPINLYSKAVDGIGQVERLTTSANIQAAHSFAPDGTLVFGDDPADGYVDLATMSLGGDGQAEVLIQTEFRDAHGNVSPDGRWLAYMSDETAQPEIYVRPFPNVNDGPWQITQDGGIAPQWGPDSRELFYQTRDGAMMVAANNTEPTFSPGQPALLFQGPYRLGTIGRHHTFDISPDGQKFLMIKEDTATNVSSDLQQIVVVQNWVEELTRLVPVN